MLALLLIKFEIDAKLIVAIYAAIVSTVVFIWRLYEYYDEKKGKIAISLKRSSQALVYANNQVGDWEQFVVATIVNRGKHKRQIERSMVKVSPLVDGQDTLSVIVFNSPNFPLGLDPGEKFEYKIPTEALDENLKSKGVRRVKCRVDDTHGSSYYSTWFNI